MIENIISAVIKKETVKSFEIIKDKSGVPYLLKVKEVRKFDRSSRLYEQMSKFGHQDLIIKTQAGNVVHGERVTKYRLDKLTDDELDRLIHS